MQEEINAYLNFIRTICPLMPEADLLKLGSSLTVQKFKKNEYFIKTGQVQKCLGFIINGLMRSYYIDNDGDEQTMRFMANMEFVIDYPALLCNEPTKYNFHCLADTILVMIPYEAILESYNTHQFDRFGRIIAEKVLQIHHARVESFLFETAEQRYIKFVQQRPDLSNKVSVTHLCSYLGVKRQTLTRIRKKIIKSK
jgi:CRP/FNR family transcriptional regulator